MKHISPGIQAVEENAASQSALHNARMKQDDLVSGFPERFSDQPSGILAAADRQDIDRDWSVDPFATFDLERAA